MAAKRNTAHRNGKPSHGSKTAFVLSMPGDMSAKDVAAKAKQQGLVFGPSYVYKVRGRAAAVAPTTRQIASKPSTKQKKPLGAAAARTGALPVSAPATRLRLSSDDPHERAILDAVCALGLTRVRSVIAAIDALFGSSGVPVVTEVRAVPAATRTTKAKRTTSSLSDRSTARRQARSSKADSTKRKAKITRKGDSRPSAARKEALAGARAAFLAAEVERQNEAFRGVNGSNGVTEPATPAAESSATAIA